MKKRLCQIVETTRTFKHEPLQQKHGAKRNEKYHDAVGKKILNGALHTLVSQIRNQLVHWNVKILQNNHYAELQGTRKEPHNSNMSGWIRFKLLITNQKGGRVTQNMKNKLIASEDAAYGMHD